MLKSVRNASSTCYTTRKTISSASRPLRLISRFAKEAFRESISCVDDQAGILSKLHDATIYHHSPLPSEAVWLSPWQYQDCSQVFLTLFQKETPNQHYHHSVICCGDECGGRAPP